MDSATLNLNKPSMLRKMLTAYYEVALNTYRSQLPVCIFHGVNFPTLHILNSKTADPWGERPPVFCGQIFIWVNQCWNYFPHFMITL